MTAIDDIGDRLIEDLVALQPAVATLLGVPGHDHEMTGYGPDSWAALDDLAARVLAEVADAPVTTDNDRITAAALTELLAARRDLHAAGLLAADLNSVASPLQVIRMVFDLTPTDDGWTNLASRLQAVPETLDGYRRSLIESARRGLAAARRQVLLCAGESARWSGEGGPSFFTALVERHGDGARRAELDKAADRANQAFAEFGRFLREDLAPLAPERDAVGAERYALWSRTFLGSSIDLAETYEWGWAEFTRIRSEMRALAGDILRASGDRDVSGTDTEVIDRAVAVLDADQARQITGRDAFRAWMQDLSDRTVADLAGTHFDIPDPVRKLECLIAPTPGGGGAYYTGPSEDFSRPGQMWWQIPEGTETFSTWRETTIVFHEGVPGHHLQIAQTMYRHDQLNRVQRVLLGWSGHAEGWALYAERLMAELGYLDDPGNRLGMLDGQALRAARVILDIGMHLELPIPAGAGFHDGERWTPDLGLDFLRRVYHADEPYRVGERDRYLGWPGQAPAYKVGERVFLAARADARARHGAAFDLKAFHTATLNLGSIGLDLLRTELTRF